MAQSQDMSRDAVKEPAVVADHHRAAGKVFQCFFQRPQGVHVEVVGGFVQQQNIRANGQCFGQVNTVALTPGKRGHLFLLVAAGKVERSAVSPAINRHIAKLEVIRPAGNFFKYRRLGVEGTALVCIT